MQLVAINCAVVVVVLLMYDVSYANDTAAVPGGAMGDYKTEAKQDATGLSANVDKQVKLHEEQNTGETIFETTATALNKRVAEKNALIKEEEAKLEEIQKKRDAITDPTSADAKKYDEELMELGEKLTKERAEVTEDSEQCMRHQKIALADDAVPAARKTHIKSANTALKTKVEEHATKIETQTKAQKERIKFRMKQTTDAGEKQKYLKKMEAMIQEEDLFRKHQQEMYETQAALSTDDTEKQAFRKQLLDMESMLLEEKEEELMELENELSLETDPTVKKYYEDLVSEEQARYDQRGRRAEEFAAQELMEAEKMVSAGATGAAATRLAETKARAEKLFNKAKVARTDMAFKKLTKMADESTDPTQKAVAKRERCKLMGVRKGLTGDKLKELKTKEEELKALRGPVFSTKGAEMTKNAEKACAAYPAVLDIKRNFMAMQFEEATCVTDPAEMTRKKSQLKHQEERFTDMADDSISICSIAMTDASDEKLQEHLEHQSQIMASRMDVDNSGVEYAREMRDNLHDSMGSASGAEKTRLENLYLDFTNEEADAERQRLKTQVYHKKQLEQRVESMPESPAKAIALQQLEITKKESDAMKSLYDSRLGEFEAQVKATGLSQDRVATFEQQIRDFQISETKLNEIEAQLGRELPQEDQLKNMILSGVSAAGISSGTHSGDGDTIFHDVFEQERKESSGEGYVDIYNWMDMKVPEITTHSLDTTMSKEDLSQYLDISIYDDFKTVADDSNMGMVTHTDTTGTQDTMEKAGDTLAGAVTGTNDILKEGGDILSAHTDTGSTGLHETINTEQTTLTDSQNAITNTVDGSTGTLDAIVSDTSLTGDTSGTLQQQITDTNADMIYAEEELAGSLDGTHTADGSTSLTGTTNTDGGTVDSTGTHTDGGTVDSTGTHYDVAGAYDATGSTGG